MRVTPLKEKLNSVLSLPPQKDIAELLGVSKSLVSQWLGGNQPCPEPYLALLVENFTPGYPNKVELLADLFLSLGQTRLEASFQKSPKGEASGKALAINAYALLKEKLEKGQALKGGHDISLANFDRLAAKMAVIVGDKREDGKSRISCADFGAVSASAAELRWLPSLNLPPSTQIFGDKVFVLDSAEQLRERFSETNLLIVGSPASNHLARRLHLLEPPAGWRNPAMVIRFNLHQNMLLEIENTIDGLRGKNRKMLIGQQGDPANSEQLDYNMRHLFSGGMIDPTYRLWKRGFQPDHRRDWGLISLCRHPFAKEGSGYVCILVAGHHLFGTARALEMLAKKDEMATHPLGGVIRVDIEAEENFAKRFDDTQASWDSPAKKYSTSDVLEGFRSLKENIPPDIFVDDKFLAESINFVRSLSPES